MVSEVGLLQNSDVLGRLPQALLPDVGNRSLVTNLKVRAEAREGACCQASLPCMMWDLRLDESTPGISEHTSLLKGAAISKLAAPKCLQAAG